MKASNIKLSNLKTVNDCYDTIVAILNDYRNYRGDSTNFKSCRDMVLMVSAKSEIKAIEALVKRLAAKGKYATRKELDTY